MFSTPIEPRFRVSPSVQDMMAFVGKPLPSVFELDLCRDQVAASRDCDVTRFAAEARKSTSRHAFKAAFTSADWRAFASFCTVRRMPAGERLLIPGRTDRTLRFVVEGGFWQAPAAGSGEPTLLPPGAIVGEDSLFSDAPSGLDVRTLEDSLILELPLSRRNEFIAAYPRLAFELLRAAGAVIAAGGRPAEARGAVATH